VSQGVWWGGVRYRNGGGSPLLLFPPQTHLGLVSNSMRQAPPLPSEVAVLDMPC